MATVLRWHNELKWDGTAWGMQTSGTPVSLRGVWALDAQNVWVVGDGGTILKWIEPRKIVV
jgi:hypothetical protein